MKIIELLTSGFKPDVRVFKEAVYLVQKGFQVTILCWDREPEDSLPSEEIVDGINVIRFRIVSPAGRDTTYGRCVSYLKYILLCRKFLRNNKYDYLQLNDISGACAGLLANYSNAPIVIDLHEYFESGSLIRRRIMHYLLLIVLKKSTAGIYENSAYLSDSYRSVRHKLYPLRNYPDSSMVEYRPKTRSEVFRIGFHGWLRSRIVEFTALFEAVKGLEDVRIDLNGGGPGLPMLQELQKKYQNVYVHGPFDGTKELSGFYEKTDLLFCGYDPYDTNYQGDAEIVKYYEAIVTGTPMIMTESIGMGAKVRKNGFGLTCDTIKPEEIRDAILQLKNNHELWQQCSNNELSQAKNYKWENIVKILDEVYSYK